MKDDTPAAIRRRAYGRDPNWHRMPKTESVAKGYAPNEHIIQHVREPYIEIYFTRGKRGQRSGKFAINQKLAGNAAAVDKNGMNVELRLVNKDWSLAGKGSASAFWKIFKKQKPLVGKKQYGDFYLADGSEPCFFQFAI